MPGRVKAVSNKGELHPSPFIGPIDHTTTVRVDVSGLDNKAVDSKGWLKPGVILTRTGALAGDGETDALKGFGAVVEAVKVAEGNTTALLGAGSDIDVAVAVICVINRDILEDSLGRALTTHELTHTRESIVFTNT